MLERGGAVKAHVIPNREGDTLQPIVRQHVKPGVKIMSDERAGYNGLEDTFLRGVVNHAVEYVNGSIHTNGMENLWSLVKRGLNRTYISVEPIHLFRYLDEQALRYNRRDDGKRRDSSGRPVKLTDAQRFTTVMAQAGGKRLTYEKLTGKEGETAF